MTSRNGRKTVEGTDAVRGRSRPVGPTRRRVTAALGSASAALLAGCLGGDGGTDDTTMADDGGTTPDSEGLSTTEAGERAGDGGGATEGGALTLYRFSRPERYEFETVDGMALDGASGTLAVDVTEADGESASVDLRYEAGEYVAEDTVSGPLDDVGTALMLSSAGGYLFSTGIVGISGYLQSRSSVTVGDVWEVGVDSAVRTEITERTTVAGVDGYRFVTSLVGDEQGTEQVIRGVYAPSLQILAEKSVEDASGETVLSKRLTAYERR